MLPGYIENSDTLVDAVYLEIGEEIRINLKLHVFQMIPSEENRCNDSIHYGQSQVN